MLSNWPLPEDSTPREQTELSEYAEETTLRGTSTPSKDAYDSSMDVLRWKQTIRQRERDPWQW